MMSHVITCLEVFNDWAISASNDSSICVWDLISGERIARLAGHIGGVWSMIVMPPDEEEELPRLVTGSTDRTTRIWLLEPPEWPCIMTLFGHLSTVRCLAACDGLVVSGSRDATLRLWDSHTGACLREFQGEEGYEVAYRIQTQV